MNGVHLTGLEGDNPLGFLAALGVQVAFATEAEQPRLWWNDGITPHAVVDDDFQSERIADQAGKVFDLWAGGPAANPRRSDGSAMPKGDELKLQPDDIREYLRQARNDAPGSSLITALVAEGSVDRNGRAKPTDLYFAAGQQKFLVMARQVLTETSRDHVRAALNGPWTYDSELPSFMWDVSDDRVYALRATDPAPEKKLTNPGAEALALLGLSLHPVFAGRGQTLTQGCSGSWKSGHYSWPVWNKPTRPQTVRSLLAHATHHPDVMDRQRWYRSWGVFKVFRSAIRRSSQGGYGTFSPPEVTWQES